MKSFLVLLLFLSTTYIHAESLSHIKKNMIRDSIANYPGVCACPYSSMRNSRSCGKRSAYSKPGGYSPLCYEVDISDQDAVDYKEGRR